MNDRSWRIVLNKSAAKLVETAREDRRALIIVCSGRHWCGQRDQLCQLSEVLDCSSEEELVLGPIWPSQPEPIKAQDALEMREQHLDLLPFTARPDIGIGLRDVARNVSGLFVD